MAAISGRSRTDSGCGLFGFSRSVETITSESMGDTNTDAERLQRTLEDHELAVKQAVESLGELQAELEEAATNVDDDRVSDQLADLGRRLETHEHRLEAVVETLDEHKDAVRGIDATGDDLAQAMERARRRARQESEPPTPHDREDS